MLPINGVSAEQAPRRRPDWGFSSVAEANLFRIRGITGVADTEASNVQGEAEEKAGGERKGEGVEWMCWQRADCVLAEVWLLVMVWIYNCWLSRESKNLRAICGRLVHSIAPYLENVLILVRYSVVYFLSCWSLQLDGICDLNMEHRLIQDGQNETVFSSLLLPGFWSRDIPYLTPPHTEAFFCEPVAHSAIMMAILMIKDPWNKLGYLLPWCHV